MGNNPTLVFVHLNSRIPTYLKLNLNATAKLFPNQKIVLIHNQDKLRTPNLRIATFQYRGSTNATNIEKNLNHPREFRNNFWFSSIARFDALKSYIEWSGESILHIESDVILSSDFPISSFGELEMRVAYPVVATNRGVASTVYLSDLESASMLIDFAVTYSSDKASATDMEILAEFAHSHSNSVARLPFGPTAKSSYHPENFPTNLDEFQNQLDFFGGIFDGNDIGVYLFGSDPRNNRGFTMVGKPIPGNFADINKWKIEYEPSRKFASINEGEISIPIYSLHATSKELSIFWNVTRSYMIKRQVRKQIKFPYKKLNFLIITYMASQKIFKILKFKK